MFYFNPNDEMHMFFVEEMRKIVQNKEYTDSKANKNSKTEVKILISFNMSMTIEI